MSELPAPAQLIVGNASAKLSPIQDARPGHQRQVASSSIVDQDHCELSKESANVIEKYEMFTSTAICRTASFPYDFLLRDGDVP